MAAPQLHNLAAERAVLGACLLGQADIITQVRAQLPADAFYTPKHATLWRIICTLADESTPADVITVPARARHAGDRWADPEDTLYVHQLYEDALPVFAPAHIAELARWARLRRVYETGTRLTQLAAGAAGTADVEGRLDDVLALARIELADVEPDTPAHALRDAVELDNFVSSDDPEFNWLVPDLLERGDRVIITGREGHGKSTLLRQIAVQLASGIHPFADDPIDPIRVLLIDLENPERLLRRALRTLHAKAHRTYRPDPGLYVVVRPAGLDLQHPEDGQWLLAVTKQLRPDLLITGPTYKMASGDPIEEATARTTVGWLDRIRAEVGCALILEAHTPYGSGNGRRPQRPYGASLWSRWPEFGIFLSEDQRLLHWRGQRDQRAWPGQLKRGGEWPWMRNTDTREDMWSQVLEECGQAGGRLSQNKLADALQVSRGMVQKLIKAHQAEWDGLAHPGQMTIPVDQEDEESDDDAA